MYCYSVYISNFITSHFLVLCGPPFRRLHYILLSVRASVPCSLVSKDQRLQKAQQRWEDSPCLSSDWWSRFEVKVQGHLVAAGLCAPPGLYSRMKSHRTFKFVYRKCHRSIKGLIKPMHTMHNNGRTDAYTLIGLCLEVTWSKVKVKISQWMNIIFKLQEGSHIVLAEGPHMFVFYTLFEHLFVRVMHR